MLSPHRDRSLHCDERVIAAGRSRRGEEPTDPQSHYRDESLSTIAGRHRTATKVPSRRDRNSASCIDENATRESCVQGRRRVFCPPKGLRALAIGKAVSRLTPPTTEAAKEDGAPHSQRPRRSPVKKTRAPHGRGPP